MLCLLYALLAAGSCWYLRRPPVAACVLPWSEDTLVMAAALCGCASRVSAPPAQPSSRHRCSPTHPPTADRLGDCGVPAPRLRARAVLCHPARGGGGPGPLRAERPAAHHGRRAQHRWVELEGPCGGGEGRGWALLLCGEGGGTMPVQRSAAGPAHALPRVMCHAPHAVRPPLPTLPPRSAPAAAATVKQRLVFVGREEGKLLALRQVIGQGLRPPVLVFVATKERAKELHRCGPCSAWIAVLGLLCPTLLRSAPLRSALLGSALASPLLGQGAWTRWQELYWPAWAAAPAPSRHHAHRRVLHGQASHLRCPVAPPNQPAAGSCCLTACGWTASTPTRARRRGRPRWTTSGVGAEVARGPCRMGLRAVHGVGVYGAARAWRMCGREPGRHRLRLEVGPAGCRRLATSLAPTPPRPCPAPVPPRVGHTWVLIATDLIGRGMDFLGVNTVVNFDFPRASASQPWP